MSGLIDAMYDKLVQFSKDKKVKPFVNSVVTQQI